MNMQWNNIVGHKQVITQLCLMQQEDRIPHAMLFCGTDGVGKSLVAEALAAAILCHAPVHNQACGHCKVCQALVAGTHPDCVYPAYQQAISLAGYYYFPLYAGGIWHSPT